MPAKGDASVVEALQALADILSGACHFFMVLVASLPTGSAALDDERPEEGPALLGSSLRCLVSDRLEPSLVELQALIAEWRSQERSEETGS
jgi:hypothetical protein